LSFIFIFYDKRVHSALFFTFFLKKGLFLYLLNTSPSNIQIDILVAIIRAGKNLHVLHKKHGNTRE